MSFWNSSNELSIKTGPHRVTLSDYVTLQFNVSFSQFKSCKTTLVSKVVLGMILQGDAAFMVLLRTTDEHLQNSVLMKKSRKPCCARQSHIRHLTCRAKRAKEYLSIFHQKSSTPPDWFRGRSKKFDLPQTVRGGSKKIFSTPPPPGFVREGGGRNSTSPSGF